MFDPNTIYTIGTVTPTFVTYVGITLAEQVGIIDPISIFEKFGVSGLVFIAAYFFIRYLLKDKERLETKIDELHKERQAESKRQIDDLKDLIQQKLGK
jgi:positive regulator of sigma E activity